MSQQPSSKHPTIALTTCTRSLINQNYITTENDNNKIVVIGACALDRLLYVPYYPKEDDKILCHETFEYGGGNAANTASGLGKLSSSSSSMLFQVQLLSKIGSDDIHRKLCHELVNSGVDLSSPLFMIGETGTTSPIATVIVTNSFNNNLNGALVQPTRTCFFDKGTCGVLESSDVINYFQNIDDTIIGPIIDTVPATNVTIVDKFFTNAKIIHSDSRHTNAALVIAKEAKRRNIPVSLDLERDRFTKSFDELINQASIIFTSCSRIDNSHGGSITCFHLKSLIDRRKREIEGLNDSHSGHNFSAFFTKEDVQMKDEEQRQRFAYYIDIISMFHSMVKLNNNEDLEMIITRGHLGALKCKIKSTTYVNTTSSDTSTMNLPAKSNIIHVNPNDDNGILNIKQSIHSYKIHDNDCIVSSDQLIEYEIHVVGPPILRQHVVDTTGAGDAFIAGYLWSKMVLLNSTTCDKEIIDFDLAMFSLRMASWVAGKKIQGPGARATLPSLEDVQNELGIGLDAISAALECKVNKISF